MQRYEYRVVPAPRRGEKAKGVRTVPERFANALSLLMNEMARGGWDYLRTDTLPCEERAGLTGSRTVFQTMLVFRRDLASEMSADFAGTEPALAPAPRPVPAPVLSAVPEAPPVPAPPVSTPSSNAPRIAMHPTEGSAADGAASTDVLLRALRKDHAAE